MVQAAYRANSAQPDARQKLIGAIHSIAGRDLILEFHSQKNAQGGVVSSPARSQQSNVPNGVRCKGQPL